MKLLLPYIFILILTSSCSVLFQSKQERQLRKAEKLIRKAKENGAPVLTTEVKKDTTLKGEQTKIKIQIKDSTVIVYKDSVVYHGKDSTIYHHKYITHFLYPKDTSITSNGININIHFKNGLLTAEAICPDKKFEETTAINQTISCPPVLNHLWQGIGIGFIIALILAGIVAYLKK